VIIYSLLLFFGIIAVLVSIYSEYLGLRFDHEVSTTLSKPPHGFTPTACVVMACKGHEPGLEKNLGAILTQNYPKYRTIIVTDTAEDPAYPIVKSVLARETGADALVFVSDSHPGASGKVAALLTALERDGGASDAFAFVDSDALIPSTWLADLIDPLGDDSIGATTGFRWYFPARRGFWPHA
jgi:cellulose synthase/poly-beta-1,6-N-acetylglucosamine synthase-like glycosyltransferase